MRYFVGLVLLLSSGFARADDSGFFSTIIKQIKEFFKGVTDKLNAIVQWVFDLVKLGVTALVDILKDVISWVFDQVLTLVGSAVDTMYSESGADALVGQVTSAWAGLPPEVTAVAASLGLGTAMTMIGTALLIRLILQLVPFTRLGS